MTSIKVEVRGAVLGDDVALALEAQGEGRLGDAITKLGLFASVLEKMRGSAVELSVGAEDLSELALEAVSAENVEFEFSEGTLALQDELGSRTTND
jgi:hypothetical protein